MGDIFGEGKARTMATFADVCCGIGGFHVALSRLGLQCVFACDIDSECRAVYKENFGIEPASDLTKIDAADVPPFDVLCAGFPCQPFSKAGAQAGFGDERGNIFFELCRFIVHHRPTHLLLENVRNFATHDKGNTWAVVRQRLTAMGYATHDRPTILNARQFGVPQSRERVFILCTRGDAIAPLGVLPPPSISASLTDLVDATAVGVLSKKQAVAAEVWDDFLAVLAALGVAVPRFPVWTDTWDGDVPPAFYAKYAGWIDKNRAFYEAHRGPLEQWLVRSRARPEWLGALRKFEWQVPGSERRTMREVLWSARGSGVRVKAADYAPTLVAMASMIPVYGPLHRELTPRECARLQSFPDDFVLHPKDKVAYKQLGNAVNVAVVERCARFLLHGEPFTDQ